MMRRVDEEESILGTELVEPKSVPLMRVDVENVNNGSAVEALWALGAPEPKKG
jgi:hypothetical protein